MKLFSNKRKNSLDFNRKRVHFEIGSLKPLAVLLVEMALVVLLAFGVVEAFGIRFSVPGESMEPTLSSGDVVLMNRLFIKVVPPNTNDVVVFLPPNNLSAQYSIKRIVATPGDTVQVKNGRIYVNGEAFHDKAETESIVDAGLASAEITLEDDEYFVMGDNRNNSEDSRYETIGNIHREDIMGSAWFMVGENRIGLVY
ncbi:MAG: signal peptidase I [Lachnospiraceae bacterium]|nr:signal peptidase I [Lachnospiraceae bacterium]